MNDNTVLRSYSIKVSTDLDNLEKQLKSAKKMLKDTLDGNDIGDGIKSQIEELSAKTDEMTKKLDSSVSSIQKAVEKTGKSTVGEVEKIQKSISETVNTLGTGIDGLITAIDTLNKSGGLSNLQSGINDTMNSIKSSLDEVMEGFADFKTFVTDFRVGAIQQPDPTKDIKKNTEKLKKAVSEQNKVVESATKKKASTQEKNRLEGLLSTYIKERENISKIVEGTADVDVKSFEELQGLLTNILDLIDRIDDESANKVLSYQIFDTVNINTIRNQSKKINAAITEAINDAKKSQGGTKPDIYLRWKTEINPDETADDIYKKIDEQYTKPIQEKLDRKKLKLGVEPDRVNMNSQIRDLVKTTNEDLKKPNAPKIRIQTGLQDIDKSEIEAASKQFQSALNVSGDVTTNIKGGTVTVDNKNLATESTLGQIRDVLVGWQSSGVPGGQNKGGTTAPSANAGVLAQVENARNQIKAGRHIKFSKASDQLLKDRNDWLEQEQYVRDMLSRFTKLQSKIKKIRKNEERSKWDELINKEIEASDLWKDVIKVGDKEFAQWSGLSKGEQVLIEDFRTKLREEIFDTENDTFNNTIKQIRAKLRSKVENLGLIGVELDDKGKVVGKSKTEFSRSQVYSNANKQVNALQEEILSSGFETEYETYNLLVKRRDIIQQIVEISKKNPEDERLVVLGEELKIMTLQINNQEKFNKLVEERNGIEKKRRTSKNGISNDEFKRLGQIESEMDSMFSQIAPDIIQYANDQMDAAEEAVKYQNEVVKDFKNKFHKKANQIYGSFSKEHEQYVTDRWKDKTGQTKERRVYVGIESDDDYKKKLQEFKDLSKEFAILEKSITRINEKGEKEYDYSALLDSEKERYTTLFNMIPALGRELNVYRQINDKVSDLTHDEKKLAKVTKDTSNELSDILQPIRSLTSGQDVKGNKVGLSEHEAIKQLSDSDLETMLSSLNDVVAQNVKDSDKDLIKLGKQYINERFSFLENYIGEINKKIAGVELAGKQVPDSLLAKKTQAENDLKALESFRHEAQERRKIYGTLKDEVKLGNDKINQLRTILRLLGKIATEGTVIDYNSEIVNRKTKKGDRDIEIKKRKANAKIGESSTTIAGYVGQIKDVFGISDEKWSQLDKNGSKEDLARTVLSQINDGKIVQNIVSLIADGISDVDKQKVSSLIEELFINEMTGVAGYNTIKNVASTKEAITAQNELAKTYVNTITAELERRRKAAEKQAKKGETRKQESITPVAKWVGDKDEPASMKLKDISDEKKREYSSSRKISALIKEEENAITQNEESLSKIENELLELRKKEIETTELKTKEYYDKEIESLQKLKEQKLDELKKQEEILSKRETEYAKISDQNIKERETKNISISRRNFGVYKDNTTREIYHINEQIDKLKNLSSLASSSSATNVFSKYDEFLEKEKEINKIIQEQESYEKKNIIDIKNKIELNKEYINELKNGLVPIKQVGVDEKNNPIYEKLTQEEINDRILKTEKEINDNKKQLVANQRNYNKLLSANEKKIEKIKGDQGKSLGINQNQQLMISSFNQQSTLLNQFKSKEKEYKNSLGAFGKDDKSTKKLAKELIELRNKYIESALQYLSFGGNKDDLAKEFYSIKDTTAPIEFLLNENMQRLETQKQEVEAEKKNHEMELEILNGDLQRYKELERQKREQVKYIKQLKEITGLADEVLSEEYKYATTAKSKRKKNDSTVFSYTKDNRVDKDMSDAQKMASFAVDRALQKANEFYEQREMLLQNVKTSEELRGKEGVDEEKLNETIEHANNAIASTVESMKMYVEALQFAQEEAEKLGLKISESTGRAILDESKKDTLISDRNWYADIASVFKSDETSKNVDKLTDEVINEVIAQKLKQTKTEAKEMRQKEVDARIEKYLVGMTDEEKALHKELSDANGKLIEMYRNKTKYTNDEINEQKAVIEEIKNRVKASSRLELGGKGNLKYVMLKSEFKPKDSETTSSIDTTLPATEKTLVEIKDILVSKFNGSPSSESGSSSSGVSGGNRNRKNKDNALIDFSKMTDKLWNEFYKLAESMKIKVSTSQKGKKYISDKNDALTVRKEFLKLHPDLAKTSSATNESTKAVKENKKATEDATKATKESTDAKKEEKKETEKATKANKESKKATEEKAKTEKKTTETKKKSGSKTKSDEDKKKEEDESKFLEKYYKKAESLGVLKKNADGSKFVDVADRGKVYLAMEKDKPGSSGRSKEQLDAYRKAIEKTTQAEKELTREEQKDTTPTTKKKTKAKKDQADATKEVVKEQRKENEEGQKSTTTTKKKTKKKNELGQSNNIITTTSGSTEQTSIEVSAPTTEATIQSSTTAVESATAAIQTATSEVNSIVGTITARTAHETEFVDTKKGADGYKLVQELLRKYDLKNNYNEYVYRGDPMNMLLDIIYNIKDENGYSGFDFGTMTRHGKTHSEDELAGLYFYNEVNDEFKYITKKFIKMLEDEIKFWQDIPENSLYKEGFNSPADWPIGVVKTGLQYPKQKELKKISLYFEELSNTLDEHILENVLLKRDSSEFSYIDNLKEMVAYGEITFEEAKKNINTEINKYTSSLKNTSSQTTTALSDQDKANEEVTESAKQATAALEQQAEKTNLQKNTKLNMSLYDSLGGPKDINLLNSKKEIESELVNAYRMVDEIRSKYAKPDYTEDGVGEIIDLTNSSVDNIEKDFIRLEHIFDFIDSALDKLSISEEDFIEKVLSNKTNIKKFSTDPTYLEMFNDHFGIERAMFYGEEGIPTNFEEIESTVEKTIDNVADGIESSKEEIAKSTTDVIKQVPEITQEVLDEHSPSRVMYQLGYWTGEGFNNGLLDSLDDIKKTIIEKLKTGEITKDDLQLLSDKDAWANDEEFLKVKKKPTSTKAFRVMSNIDTTGFYDIAQEELKQEKYSNIFDKMLFDKNNNIKSVTSIKSFINKNTNDVLDAIDYYKTSIESATGKVPSIEDIVNYIFGEKGADTKKADKVVSVFDDLVNNAISKFETNMKKLQKLRVKNMMGKATESDIIEIKNLKAENDTYKNYIGQSEIDNITEKYENYGEVLSEETKEQFDFLNSLETTDEELKKQIQLLNESKSALKNDVDNDVLIGKDQLRNLQTKAATLYKLTQSPTQFVGGGLTPKDSESVANMLRNMQGIRKESVIIANDGRNIVGTIEKAKGQLQTIEYKWNDILGVYTQSTKVLTSQLSIWDRLKGQIKKSWTYLKSYLGGYLSAMRLISTIRQGISYVRELDKALTEMKKVSDETTSSLKNFQKQSFKTASEIGSTAAQIQNSAADFMRLGYSLNDAAELAKHASIYANVGDMEISTATEHMISSIQAWQSEFSSATEASMALIDKYNKIGNNYAITSADIGSAMERSAAALKTAGNTIDESIGLITAGNLIQQDADTTANALKVMSLRIRGSKADLEEMGEETDDLATSTSKLRNEIKALTGVDIMLDEKTYKSTAKIIQEIGKNWDRLDDVSKATTLEKLAGKTRASTVAGLIENYKTIGEVAKDAADSEGSAFEENAKYIDSVEGKIQQLTNSVQEFWHTAIDSKSLKDVISVSTTVLNSFTKLSNLFGSDSFMTTIGALYGFTRSAFKGYTAVPIKVYNKKDENGVEYKKFGTWIGANKQDKENISYQIKEQEKLAKSGSHAIKEYYGLIDSGVKKEDALSRAFTKTNESVKQYVDGVDSADEAINNFTNAQNASIMSLKQSEKQLSLSTRAINTFKNIAATALNTAISFGISWAISQVINAINFIINYESKIAEAASDAVNQIENTSKSIDDYKDKIDELKKVINDSESSEEQVTQARRDLISVQEEVVKQFRNEADAADIVTEAINKQTGALDKLKQKTYQVAENKFNDSGWWENRWLHLNGYKDRLDKMEKDYLSERTESISIEKKDLKKGLNKDILNDLSKIGNFRIFEGYGVSRLATEEDTLDSLLDGLKKGKNINLEFVGSAEEVYDKILDFQTIIGKNENLKSLNNEASKLAKKYSKLDEQYHDFAQQYILNKKVLNNDDYAELYLDVINKHDAYIDAYSTGDKDKIEQATRDFMQSRQDAILKSSADPNVQKFFTNMFEDEMANAIKDVNFKDKLSSDTLFKKLLPYLGEDFKSAYAQYQKDLQDAIEKGIADTEGNIQEVTVGNINTANRQVLSWSERNLKLYKDEVESWGDKIEDYRDSISTVDSRSMEFDDVEITFTPILNTNNGPQYLDQDTMIKYIDSLIDSAEQQGLDWKLDANVLLDLDKQGATINGKTINNMLLGTGEVDASLTHLAGTNGAVAQSFNYLQESVQSFYSTLSKEDIVNVEALEGYEDKVLDAMDKINLDLAKGTGDALTNSINKVANDFEIDKNSVLTIFNAYSDALTVAGKNANPEEFIQAFMDGASSFDMDTDTLLSIAGQVVNYALEDVSKEDIDKAVKESANGMGLRTEEFNNVYSASINGIFALIDAIKESGYDVETALDLIGITSKKDIDLQNELTKAVAQNVKTTKDRIASLYETFEKINSGDLTPDELIDFLSDEDNAKFLKSIDNLGDAINDEIKSQLDEAKKLIGDASPELTKALEESTKKAKLSIHLDKINEDIDKLQEGMKTLSSTFDEYNENGFITLDTLQSLMAENGEYLQMLTVEDGQLKINMDAYKELTAQKLLEYRSTLDQAAAAEINALANKNESEEISATTQLLDVKTFAYEEATHAAIKYATTVGNVSQEEIDSIVNKYDQLYQATIDGFSNNFKQFAGITSASAKDASNAAKEALDNYIAVQDALLDAGKISFQDYCTNVKNKLDEMYSSGKLSAKDYFDSVKTFLEKQQSIYDKILNSVTRRFDKEIDSIQKQIDAINEENDALNKQKDEYDKILSVVQEVYDNEIKSLNDQKDAIQEKIDALQDANDEEDRALALANARYALEKAQQQRTRLVYSGEQGFVYKQDEEAIRSAKKELKQAELDNTISLLEKEQEALDKDIEKLEEYKEKWSEVSETYDKEVNRQLAIQMFGENYEQIILQNREQDIKDFTDKYVALQKKVDDNTSLIESFEEKKKYYEELKQQWQDITSVYEQSIEDQLTAERLGADWERDILENRTGVLEKFKNEYIAIQEQIKEAAIASAEAQKAADQGGSGSGGSTQFNTGGADKQIKSYTVIDKATQRELSDRYYDTREEAELAAKTIASRNPREIGTVLETGINGYKIYEKKKNGTTTPFGNKQFSSYEEALNALNSDEYQKKLKEGRNLIIQAFSKGGVISAKSNKSPLTELANRFGEDTPVLAKHGERILTPVQNKYWEKWTNALPNLTKNIDALKFNIPNFGSILGAIANKETTVKQEISISLPNVTNNSGAEYVINALKTLPLEAVQRVNRR